MKQKIIYILTVILSAAFIMGANQYIKQDLTKVYEDQPQQYENATVQEITSRVSSMMPYEGEEDVLQTEISFSALLTKGENKGEVVNCVQTVNTTINSDLKAVEEGDKIIVVKLSENSATETWTFISYRRTTPLIILGIIFLILLILFGHFNGISTILSLTFTILAIFAVFVPAILAGYNIYLWAVIICAYILAMTLLLVNGANKKSLASAIGCAGGLLASGLILFISDKFLLITGIVSEESVYLTYLNTPTPIDLKAIIYGAVIIGAIGAIMDVAVNISSALHEVVEQAGGHEQRTNFQIGYNHRS